MTTRHVHSSKAVPARLRVYDQEIPSLAEYLAQCDREDLEDARAAVGSARQSFEQAVEDLKDAYANLARLESRGAPVPEKAA